ncbi:F0F1 ATP synthase subunit epsilon [Defluviimonas sp. WL0024]|uniref:ATP synthase epsilon chain n=2 Tax=Albidovulum TaxID=205889 RepID=A0ABT3J4U2_9RHOB|nr:MULTISPECIES: F0F1 ATP synthase subunit epsilon [Defluviimonas]MCU9849168.1 F0F1 ATP synthase subunit epsilon [Defluviimonas sp. WL0024]MCW3782705.1 F0F1 ATP synthase subunit epsilon [Defluviimonas salinarum]
MADTMQFDLVSPERRLASVQAREVRIPGADGDLTAMPDHSPLITTLRPGILTVVTAEGMNDYAVIGGFAEISAAGASVLAERAMPKAEVKASDMDALIADATAEVAEAPAEGKDAANKLVADLQALKAALGL